jgi:hypothetical protein
VLQDKAIRNGISFSTSALAVLTVVPLLASVGAAETRFPLIATWGPDDYVVQLCRHYSIWGSECAARVEINCPTVRWRYPLLLEQARVAKCDPGHMSVAPLDRILPSAA